MTADLQWPLVAACGKFQPFHSEHLAYILEAIRVGEHVIVGITNPDPHYVRFEPMDPQRSTPESNPFTYYERYLMVRGSLEEAGVGASRYDIVPFPLNVPESWFCYIPQEAVFLVTLYDDDEWLLDRKHKLIRGGVRTHVLWHKPGKTVVGTDIRARIRAGLEWESMVPPATARIIKSLRLSKQIPI
jgi:nicotinamide mononucleotide adenylyltransferase